jgi:hypothetical protein
VRKKVHPKKKVEINFKKSVSKRVFYTRPKKQKDKKKFVSYDQKYSTNDQK